MNARHSFDELVAAGTRQDIARAAAVFADLPPIEPEAMIGDWDGGLIPTGHPGEAQLDRLGWRGKRFHDAERVDPIVSEEDGVRVANPVLGAARLRAVGHGGGVTAAMIYDDHPVIDYFRRVDDERVMGVMDRKGDAAPLYFYLRRRASTQG